MRESSTYQAIQQSGIGGRGAGPQDAGIEPIQMGAAAAIARCQPSETRGILLFQPLFFGDSLQYRLFLAKNAERAN